MAARYVLIVPLVLSCAQASDDMISAEFSTARFRAQFSCGALTFLVNSEGSEFVRRPAEPVGLSVHLVEAEHRASNASGAGTLNEQGSTVRRYTRLADLDGATADCTFRIEPASGDLVLQQSCTSPAAGVWGVSWQIAEIPLEYAIIVPGRSGIRLTSNVRERQHTFDYPVGWEAQLVIVEGPGSGFYVWAEDTVGRFKRLVVERRRTGWRLQLATMNFAPFDQLDSCRSVAWHLNVYQGDWRVPARRYRQWAETKFNPTPIERQKPDWIRDIRTMVIMGLDQNMAETLTERLDPQQTILYVPSWRAAGYDRDYPVYDAPRDELRPFIERAHELGFRVMLHVNYFGVDPLNPLYRQFEPHQIRSPWGDHEKLWWLWTRAEPEIRFAYINPALPDWRKYFVEAMVKLCSDYQVDALHLDQTLCIFNDHNGPLDGMSMLDGNIALHRQLREALPHVALSGEGLNEVTYRHEAFAQRHVWGIDHTKGTWVRSQLATAHPISSYLFRPYTIINGYLGCAPPVQGQLYAAWNEAYEHWGVIPTLKPAMKQLLDTSQFSRQCFDEATFWQKRRLQIDMEAPWPDEVAFPFTTEDGCQAARTTDGRFVCGEEQISRTVTGVNRVACNGTIPGWLAYDEREIFGLDPNCWYPCFADRRPLDRFRIAELPENCVVNGVFRSDRLLLVRLRSLDTIVADLVAVLDEATCGSRPFRGEGCQQIGPLSAPDGAGFTEISEGIIAAHPPWKVEWTDPETGRLLTGGTGVAYAQYCVRLPADCPSRLVTDVGLDSGAVGPDKSDGVTFAVRVRADGQELLARLHHAGDRPRAMQMDLARLRGRSVAVELSVDPGPDRSPSYDWARWYQPRIERVGGREVPIAFAGSGPWETALVGLPESPIEYDKNVCRLGIISPGGVVLLRRLPEPIVLPSTLGSRPHEVFFASRTGQQLHAPIHAGFRPDRIAVGGEVRDAFHAHPPDNGRTMALFPMTLPGGSATFRSWIGIRDGSRSEGVLFIVEVNGQELARQPMVPGEWEPFSADLSPWAGKAMVLALITDADGSHHCDWACWGEPRIEAK